MEYTFHFIYKSCCFLQEYSSFLRVYYYTSSNIKSLKMSYEAEFDETIEEEQVRAKDKNSLKLRY